MGVLARGFRAPWAVSALLLAVAGLLADSEAPDRPPSWLSQAHAVIAGVLTFENPVLGNFSDEGRKDRELADLLIRRGVPAGNVALLLDGDVKAAAVLAALEKAAKRSGPEDTLIFYYAGHGLKLPDGRIIFITQDCDLKRPDKPPVALEAVAGVLARHFRGKRVLLLADCCNSGGLKEVAAALGKAGIPAASLTSAEPSNDSTANWTYTMTLLGGLRGDPLADADGDGTVTLGELAAEVASAMKFRESQKACFSSHGVEAGLGLAPVSGKCPPPVEGGFALREYVQALDPGAKGEKRPGRIVGGSDGKYAVEFFDYSARRTALVDPSQVERPVYRLYGPGTSVTALWEGKPYPAKVLKVEGDFHFVTYPGWPSYWDEWVLSDRIVSARER